MIKRLQALWSDFSPMQITVFSFAAVVILSVWIAAISGYYFLAGLPVVFIFAYLALVDFKIIYWLLIAAIPLSTEVYLPNGLGTDLPTEPLIVGLMLLFGLAVLSRWRTISSSFLTHPITLVLLLHLGWTFCTMVTSDLLMVSVKFFLAKLWYIATFVFLTAYLIRNEKDYQKFFWIFFWPFLIVVIIVIIRHAMHGFSFADIHKVLHPFQRNHVNYAASLALFYPIIVFAIGWYPKGHWRRYLLVGTAVLFFVAIYFSYTRAAYVALIIAFGTYYIIQWRWIKYALFVATISALIGAAFVVQNNKYLDYAPNFERTITHENFDNLLEATYKMEDISTMERLYRWVAAGQMSPERPLLGWGPGNFVNFYESYTVTSFQTYVSDNPERSGIHSYFLMLLVEQGLPGLLIFTILLFVFFMRGEKLYHALAEYPKRQRLVMMVLLSQIVICSFLLINDLIETDKIGSFFFINIAMLINQELFLLKMKSNKSVQSPS